jgi:hypothetical protein
MDYFLLNETLQQFADRMFAGADMVGNFFYPRFFIRLLADGQVKHGLDGGFAGKAKHLISV